MLNENMKDARDIYTRLLKENPNDHRCYFGRAFCLHWGNFRIRKGERDAQKSVRLDPSNNDYRVLYAHFLS